MNFKILCRSLKPAQSDGSTGDNEANSSDLRSTPRLPCALCILNELEHILFKPQINYKKSVYLLIVIHMILREILQTLYTCMFHLISPLI